MNIDTLLDYLHLSKDLLRIIVILITAWAPLGLSRRLIRLFRNYMNTRAGSAEEVRRIETLARVFRYTATIAISLVAGMLALSELGISIAPILGAAGVAGIAIGFGAYWRINICLGMRKIVARGRMFLQPSLSNWSTCREITGSRTEAAQRGINNTLEATAFNVLLPQITGIAAFMGDGVDAFKCRNAA